VRSSPFSAVLRPLSRATLAAALLSAFGAPARAAEAAKLTGDVDAKGLAAAIASQRGKIVLVNFWATWCVPCREEFPDLVRLEKAYRARGVSVIGVSIDLPKDMPKIEKFLSANAPDFPNYIKRVGGDDQDFIESVDPKWGGELPFTAVYGRDGKKVEVLSGKQSYASFEKAVASRLK
jgi:thiol-disulfide isomerase/thioredoxin